MSKIHTAVKIEPGYQNGVIHVVDASRAVGVVSNLLSDARSSEYAAEVAAEYATLRDKHAGRRSRKQLATFADAQTNRLSPDWDTYTPPVPRKLGLTVFDDYDLEELSYYIDWTPFFRTWELAGKFPYILEDEVVGRAATNLWQDAQEMLRRVIDEKWLQAKAVIGLFPANSLGDVIALYANEARMQTLATVHCLRQQMQKPPGRPNLSLADYVAPAEADVADYMGMFAVTAGIGLDKKAAEFEAAHDDYAAIMLKALADRLAEAFAERLHERVRQEFWGYECREQLTISNEQLVMSNERGGGGTVVRRSQVVEVAGGKIAAHYEQLIAEEYRGIRPAPGYPACPDHTEKGTLFEVLNATAHTTIELTESFAMTPTAAVSGFYFSHPEAKYFGLGRIDKDQVEDYARRKGMHIELVERWLAPNLGYDID